MGSPLRVLVNGAASALAEDIWTAVQADIESTEDALSRFRPKSSLSELNRHAGDGQGMLVPVRLRMALVCAERARRMSGGLFEPRVIGALAALGYVGPPPEGSAQTKGWAGPLLEFCGDGRVRLDEPLDLDGIGKGLALRWAARTAQALLSPGSGLLIEAGGDLVMAGQPPASGESLRAGWSLGIEDPASADHNRLLATLILHDGALATSSTRLGHWISPGGLAVHHLVDPRSGLPGGDGLTAVSVAHTDPAWAEVWTKILFFAGARDIGAQARAQGLAVWWVRSDGQLEMTPAARSVTRWTTQDAVRPER